jgi:hypothetical protein
MVCSKVKCGIWRRRVLPAWCFRVSAARAIRPRRERPGEDMVRLAVGALAVFEMRLLDMPSTQGAALVPYIESAPVPRV